MTISPGNGAAAHESHDFPQADVDRAILAALAELCDARQGSNRVVCSHALATLAVNVVALLRAVAESDPSHRSALAQPLGLLRAELDRATPGTPRRVAGFVVGDCK